MEFFDINYCRALIESNKSEDVFYKIEKLKNNNNQCLNNLLKIEIKLNFQNLENVSKLKKYNLIIIKNLIEHYLLIKEIKMLNIKLLNGCLVNNDLIGIKPILKNDNINEIIKNIMDNIIKKDNKYKISILKLQKLFNFKNNKNIKYIFNSYYSKLTHELILFYEYKDNDNDNDNKIILLSNIKILLDKISQISVRQQLMLDIILFFKNKKIIQLNKEKNAIIKNKLILTIEKKNKQVLKLKSNIEKNIKLHNKKQKEFNNKTKKIYMRFLLFTNILKTNQIIINKYKESINSIKNKKKISNNMNKNYNKCKKFNKNDDITCSICLDQIEEGVITSCNHIFHLECINLYVNNILNNPIINIICPMCRAYI